MHVDSKSFVVYIPKLSSCCMRKITGVAVLIQVMLRMPFLSFDISKVIKLIVFNSRVIMTCELVNRDIQKNYIFI